MLYTWRQSEI